MMKRIQVKYLGKSLLVRFLLIVLFSSALYIFPAQKVNGAELLVNGGFETHTNGVPTGWQQFDPNQPVAVSTDTVYSGGYSLKLEDPSTAAQPGLRSANIPIIPGAAYRATVFAHVSAQTGGPDLYLEFWDHAGTRIQTETKAASPLNDWQKLTIVQTAPANAAYATLLLYGSSAYAGTTYFDQASLSMIPSAEQGPELLANGGFESQTNGYAADWEQLDVNMPVSVSAYNAYSGGYSLKLEDPSAAAQLGVRSARVPVVPGGTYRTSVEAYTHLVQTGAAELYLEFWDYSGTRIQVDIQAASLSSEWQKLTIEQVAPANAAFVSIVLYGNSSHSGIVYFDRASLTGPELLVNGGFETHTNGVPTGWQQFDPNYPVAVSTDTVYSGSYSLKLEDPTTTAQPGLRSANIQIIPGETYRATVFAHVSAQTGGPDLYLEFWDHAGTRIQTETKAASPLNDWQKLTIVQTAPANAAYATLLLYGSSAYAGTTYFDQASLSMIPSAEQGPELLANGGFESQTNGYAADWEQLDVNMPVSVSAYNAYSGGYSLKLEDPSAAAQVGLRSIPVPIVPGGTYQASALVYTHLVQTGHPDIYLEFWNSSGSRIQVDMQSAAHLHEWQKVAVQGTAPADAVSATVLIYGNSAYEGIAYLDHVSLTRGPELVANGGFEIQTNGSAFGWHQLEPSLPLAVSTENVYAGNYSLKLVDPSAGAQTGLRSAPMPVTPGQAYRAFTLAYITASTGSPDLYLEFWDSAGTRIQVDARAGIPVNEWQGITIQQAAPANAAYATVLLYGNSLYAGTAYFDQVSLTRISFAEFKKIMNGGFEQVTGGMPADWTQLTPSVPAISATDMVYEGARSVKLVNPNTTAMGLRSAKVPVTPGKEYRASVQNYIVHGTDEIYFEFWNSAGQRVANYIQFGIVRNQWNPLVLEVTSPPDAVSATILLLNNSISTSYYDQAVIEEISPEPVLYFPLQETSHPRLYFTEDDIASLIARSQDTTSNPSGRTGQQLWNEVQQKADLYLAETNHFTLNFGGDDLNFALPPTQPGHIDPPPGYTTAYPYWTQISREIQNRLEVLSLAYVITGQTAYAEKAKAYVMSMTGWNTWTDPEYECGATCLDTVHITMGMSAAYDMLFDLFTPTERSQIEAALFEMGLEPLYADSLAKIDGNGQIVKAAALAAGASVLHGVHPDTQKYLTRAFNYMQWYLEQRMQSGQNEGFLYTDYSIEKLAKASDQVARTTGINGLLQHAFFNDFVVRWSNYFLAPGGTGLAAFSDTLSSNYFPITMNILNGRSGNGLAGWYNSQANPTSAEIVDNFLYFDPDQSITQPDILPTSAVFPEVGWAALRSGWTEGDTLLAFQSNQFATGHNHFDQNSFQIATNGSWIARDPGYQDFRLGAYHDFTVRMGHSTIQVDGQGQTSLGGSSLTKGILSSSYDYVKGSAAAAYLQPKLEKYDRHIVYVKPHYFVMLDDLEADVPRYFDWVMFNGPLYDYRVDGTTVVPGQTEYGNDLYVHNGKAQISAKFLSEDSLPITVTQYPDAENYGYSVKVRNGDQKQTDFRFVTVFKAKPFAESGYYQAEDLTNSMSTTASKYELLSTLGTRFARFSMDQIGDYVSYQINIANEGDYQFTTAFIDSPVFGNVQAYVDGQPIGTAFQAGTFGYVPTTPKQHGIVHLTAGQHTLRYEVAGKNTDANGYSFAIDSIQLVPAGEAVIDAQMQIDAQPLQESNAIGARIERGDGSTISDLVIFKTSGSHFALEGVTGDADQAVVSLTDNGDYAGYALSGGTSLMHDGNVLLQGSAPFNAAMAYDTSAFSLKGTMEADVPMTVSLHATSAAQISVNEVLLNSNQYAYDANAEVLTISLPAGTHEISVQY